ncbi:MAG TPA: DUF2844 domain-containing protein [Casimicrobiaceae bacterium]|nr:DUF2844 domain-containing protein [Casimicrobiaceae bacterium]
MIHFPERTAGAIAAVAALALLAVAPLARATLGGTEATVELDQAQMHGVLKTKRGARFSVHELKADSRATVREYVAPSGVVFGVAWQGSSMPDLRQLLGPYFDQYLGAAATRRTRRAPVVVVAPGLVVESTGHMRSFAGRAYLPQSMPPGVSPEDVQ